MITFRRVTRSEWTKLWSLRSTWISLAVVAALVVFFGLVQSYLTSRHPADPGHDAVSAAMNGFGLAPFAIGVLGVLVISAEYSTGMIRATLSAVPNRLAVLWAKALVFGAVTFGVTLAAALVVFVCSQLLFLSGTRLSASLGDHGVLRSLVGAALYASLFGVLSLGLGALLRNTAAGITAMVGLLLLLPGLIHFLAPHGTAGRYLPGTAGQAIMSLTRPADVLGPWAGLAVLCAYPVVALGGAAFLLARRDA